MPGLDVSRGKTLTFAADDASIAGVTVSSQKGDALYASVIVETNADIRPNSQLTIPGSKCGGCGLASPQRRGDRTIVELQVSYGCIDMSTLGK